MAVQNYKLLLASLLVVVSALCLEGFFGTSLSLNAERRGETNTFDVSATFTAVDVNGTAMTGASVYCTDAPGQFSLKGTTNSDGTFSFGGSSVLADSDCPKKEVTWSCYARKGDTKTDTVSDTVELRCRSAEASTSTPTAAPTAVLTQACDLGCKSSGSSGGACAPAGVIGPRCFEDVEPEYKSHVNGASGQVVSWMSSSISENYECEGDNTCYCYNLQTCGEEGCRNGKCIVPTAPQAKGATGTAACSTIGKTCTSSTCGSCDAPSTVDGCVATCG